MKLTTLTVFMLTNLYKLFTDVTSNCKHVNEVFKHTSKWVWSYGYR